jgi:PPM family protein phosphatase
LNFIVYAYTDVGAMRAGNEDAISHSITHAFTVLADGMGGHNAGEVASQHAVDSVSAGIERFLGACHGRPTLDEAQSALKILIAEQNKAIYALANLNPAYEGMGCTLVVVWLIDKQALIANVGDSRCYHLSQGVLKQITRDHSFLQFQIDHGLITEAESQSGQAKNYLLRAMGTLDKVSPDFFEVDLQAGDVLLACSDGMTEALSNQQLLEKISEVLDHGQPAQELVKAAIDSGSRDNISVQLIYIEQAHAINDQPQPQSQRKPDGLRKWLGFKLRREQEYPSQSNDTANEQKKKR